MKPGSTAGDQPRDMHAALWVLSLLTTLIGWTCSPCEAANRRFTVADDIAFVQFRHPFSEVAEPDIFSPDSHYFFVDQFLLWIVS